MKYILMIILTAFILCVSCKGKDSVSASIDNNQDSITATVSEIVRGRVVEDTVIGHWTIKSLKGSNDVIVGRQDCAVRDSSVFLTLSYDRNIVYSDKEILTKDLVGNEGEYMMQWGGEVFWVSDSAIYLSFGCFIPDSDDGWNMLYQILPDGTSNIIVIDVYMGVDGFDVVADFMALYLNERAVGALPADLKRLYEQYCSKELAEELSAATFPIVLDNTDFRHADRTLQINNLEDLNSLPLEKYSFEVKFKPYPSDDNVTDILYMDVDESTNKIININSGGRIVI